MTHNQHQRESFTKICDQIAGTSNNSTSKLLRAINRCIEKINIKK